MTMTMPTPTTVRYRDVAPRGTPPLADLFTPPAARASVVLVHGGGFVIGSRRMSATRNLAARLVAADIAVCAIDYRLIFRGGGVAAAVDDACAAFAFWRARAPDPDAISLVGLSAGGTIAMLAAARLPGVHRLACAFGLYESNLLLRKIPMPPVAVPTLLLHGDADRLVPVGQARRLAAARAAAGLPTTLAIYPGARHGFFRAASEASEAGGMAIIGHVRASE
ncbi:MAG: alpha/beta hydrolase [Proteobacteria bacterium]|nr:alpha/beta hydrolase [Pseudomonadota bacterium]